MQCPRCHLMLRYDKVLRVLVHLDGFVMCKAH